MNDESMKNDRSIAAMVAKAINAYESDDGFEKACMLAHAMGGQRSEDGHEEGESFCFAEDGSALLIEAEGCVASVLSSGEWNSAWHARLETRNFVFEAYGRNFCEAEANLLKTLIEHAKQYQLEDDWFYSNMDFSIRQVSLNSGLRDREEIVRGDPLFVERYRNGTFLPGGCVVYSNF